LDRVASAAASMKSVLAVSGVAFSRSGAPPAVERYRLKATLAGSVPSMRQLT
jgi:hypothetical protein